MPRGGRQRIRAPSTPDLIQISHRRCPRVRCTELMNNVSGHSPQDQHERYTMTSEKKPNAGGAQSTSKSPNINVKPGTEKKPDPNKKHDDKNKHSAQTKR